MHADAVVLDGQAQLAVFNRQQTKTDEAAACADGKPMFEGIRHGFDGEKRERNGEIARRYAELALFDQPLVTPAHELDMLARLRASEFNDFAKANVRWDAGVVCAIGEGPVLEGIR